MRTMVGRAGNAVKRLHTVNVIIPETVGHHSANVCAIIMEIYTPVLPPGVLLAAALIHDWPEQYTGDIPAPAKWDSDALKATITGTETRWYVENSLPMPEHMLDADLLALLKFSDMFDLACKANEECHMGNKAMEEIHVRAMEYCRGKLPHLDSQFRTRCTQLLETLA